MLEGLAREIEGRAGAPDPAGAQIDEEALARMGSGYRLHRERNGSILFPGGPISRMDRARQAVQAEKI